MARIVVTGSTDGLGRGVAQQLLDDGHDVVAHARTVERSDALRPLIDRGATCVVGDLADPDQTRAVAEQVNRLSPIDAVIHNAGVSTGPDILAVNVVAPYLLTALIERPARLVYLSSGMHRGGNPNVADQDWSGRRATATYSDSKLLVTVLAMAVAAKWPTVFSNAVDPGWVATRMGGPGAPDDFDLGCRTQTWLATRDDPAARTTGGYWHHQRRQAPHQAVEKIDVQEQLLEVLTAVTGTPFRD